MVHRRNNTHNISLVLVETETLTLLYTGIAWADISLLQRSERCDLRTDREVSLLLYDYLDFKTLRDISVGEFMLSIWGTNSLFSRNYYRYPFPRLSSARILFTPLTIGLLYRVEPSRPVTSMFPC